MLGFLESKIPRLSDSTYNSIYRAINNNVPSEYMNRVEYLSFALGTSMRYMSFNYVSWYKFHSFEICRSGFSLNVEYCLLYRLHPGAWHIKSIKNSNQHLKWGKIRFITFTTNWSHLCLYIRYIVIEKYDL